MAGPYAKFGEPVVEACLAEGAHYVDITGGAPQRPPPALDHVTGSRGSPAPSVVLSCLVLAWNHHCGYSVSLCHGLRPVARSGSPALQGLDPCNHVARGQAAAKQ